jgi:hypothetical protein
MICYCEEGAGADDIKVIVDGVVLNEALFVGVDPEKIEKVGILSSGNYPHAMPDLFENIPRQGTRCPQTRLSRSAMNGLLLLTKAN